MVLMVVPNLELWALLSFLLSYLIRRIDLLDRPVAGGLKVALMVWRTIG
jgi:hypothetical protein